MNRTDMEVLRDELKNSIKDYLERVKSTARPDYYTGRFHEKQSILFRVEAIIARAKELKTKSALMGGKI